MKKIIERIAKQNINHQTQRTKREKSKNDENQKVEEKAEKKKNIRYIEIRIISFSSLIHHRNINILSIYTNSTII